MKFSAMTKRIGSKFSAMIFSAAAATFTLAQSSSQVVRPPSGIGTGPLPLYGTQPIAPAQTTLSCPPDAHQRQEGAYCLRFALSVPHGACQTFRQPCGNYSSCPAAFCTDKAGNTASANCSVRISGYQGPDIRGGGSCGSQGTGVCQQIRDHRPSSAC
jgi:hypothetical protein